jgi:hypothetical protein
MIKMNKIPISHMSMLTALFSFSVISCNRPSRPLNINATPLPESLKLEQAETRRLSGLINQALLKNDWKLAESIHNDMESRYPSTRISGAHFRARYALHYGDYLGVQKYLKLYFYGDDKNKVWCLGSEIERAWLACLLLEQKDNEGADKALAELFKGTRVHIPELNTNFYPENCSSSFYARLFIYLSAFHISQLNTQQALFYFDQAKKADPNIKLPPTFEPKINELRKETPDEDWDSSWWPRIDLDKIRRNESF